MLNAEQKAAIEDAIELTTLGLHDNYCGVAGGVSEVVGLGANSLRLAGTATIGFSVAAFAGAAGAFMNAAQNFHKASRKSAEGEVQFFRAYAGVTAGYGLAGIAFTISGAEIITHWFLTRKVAQKALETSLRGVAGAAFGGGVRLLGLSLTGWGLVFTVGSFAVEGIVGYYDRSELEQWVENSYFGTEPRYRGAGGKGNDPALWDQEAKAFADALKAAEVDGAAAA